MKKIGDIVSKKRPLVREEKKSTKEYFSGKTDSPNFTLAKRKPQVKSFKAKHFELFRHWLLTILIFLFPLWFLPWTTDQIGLPKQVLLTIFVGLVFVLWLYQSLNQGVVKYRKSMINPFIWLLIIVFVLNAFFSIHPVTSIYASSANFPNLWNIILLSVFSFLVAEDKRKKSTKKWYNKLKFVDILIASSGILIVYTLLQLFGLNPLGALTGNISFNPIGSLNSVSLLAGLTLLMSATRLTTSEIKQKILKGFLIAAALLSFIFLILVNFQTSWYALVLGGAVLILLKIKRRGAVSEIREMALPISILVISLILATWGLLANRLGMWQPQLSLGNIPSEVSPTTELSLQIAQESFKEKGITQELFGVGLGNYDKIWLKYRPESLSQTDFWQAKFSQGSSSFMTWLVEVGYIGLLAFALLAFGAIWQSARALKDKFREKDHEELTAKTKKEDKSEVNSCIVGVFYLLFVWFFYPLNLTLYFILFLMLGILTRKGSLKKIDFSKPIQKALIITLGIIVVMVATVFIVYFEAQRYIASVYYNQSLQSKVINIQGLEEEEIVNEAQSEINKKINQLARSYNLDRTNDMALRSISQFYLQKLNLSVNAGETNDLASLSQNAVLAAQRAVEIDGTSYSNQLNLGKVYEDLIGIVQGAYDLAIENYDKALKLNPSSPEVFLRKGQSQYLRAIEIGSLLSNVETNEEKEKMVNEQETMLEESINNLNEAVRLKNNYTSVHFLLAQIFDAQGRIEEAITSTSNLVILNPSDSSLWFRLGVLHFKNNDMPKTIAALNEAVRINEEYSNARYFLGLAHSNQGDSAKAISQFEKILELNPENEEVEKIIENLRADKFPLEGIVPPAESPENRNEEPIQQ